jgi:hypothetical protein
VIRRLALVLAAQTYLAVLWLLDSQKKTISSGESPTMAESDKTHALLVRLPIWQHDWVERLAKQRGESKSSIVRQYLIKGQQAEKDEQGGAS